jgi:hypothetical protein
MHISSSWLNAITSTIELYHQIEKKTRETVKLGYFFVTVHLKILVKCSKEIKTNEKVLK